MLNELLSLPALLLTLGALTLGVLSVRKAVLQWPLIWNEDLVEDSGTRSMIAAYFLYHVLVASFVALFLVINIVGRFEQASHPAVIFVSGVVLGLAFWVGRAFEKAQNTGLSDEPELLYFVRYCQYLIKQQEAKHRAELVLDQVPASFRRPADVSARSILPTMRYIRLKYGAETLASKFAELGMPAEYVDYHESVLSLEFVDLFLQRLVELEGGDINAVFRAQSCGGNIECMGAVFFILARFVSLKRVFESFIGAANHFDRVCSYKIIGSETSSMLVKLSPRKGNNEKVRASAKFGLYSVAGWFSAIPNLRGLPSAEVKILENHLDSTTGHPFSIISVQWFSSVDDFNASRTPVTQVN